MTALSVITQSTFTASAQNISLGKQVYERLKQTQIEYQQAVAAGDSLKMAEFSYRLGKRYNSLGDYLTAQQWFIKSLKIREPRKQYEDIGKVYLFMANHQVEQKNYVDAKRMGWRAITNFKMANSPRTLMRGSLVMANVHSLGYMLNQETPGRYPNYSLDSALYYFQQAETLALMLKVPVDVANVYYLKSLILSNTNPKLGITYLKKAYALFLKEKIAYPIISSSFALASIYLSLHQPTQASQWLSKARYVIDTARAGDYKQQSQLLQSYTGLYEQTGNWEKALETYKKYHDLTVKTLNADRNGAISRLEMQYESQKKEEKLKAQQDELSLRQETISTQQKLTLVTTILLSIVGIACVIFYWLFRKFKRLSVHNARLVKEQNHRVKNNLQSITSLLDLQFNRLTDVEARRAVEESLLRVEAMALVHQRLYDGDRLVEVEATQYISELVNGVLRSFNFDYIQPEYSLDSIWLSADTAINVGLLLNELVTNSCKYALPFQPTPALSVGCQREQGRIHVWVADNGPGFDPTALRRNSFGMKLIQMVTEKLKGKAEFTTQAGCHFSLYFDDQVPLLVG